MKLCNDTITVFNARLDTATDRTVYDRTILTGVSWYSTLKAAVGDKELKAANVYTIRIPVDVESEGKSYTEPDEHTSSESWTLNEGDFIVYGASALVNPTYLRIIHKYNEKERMVFPELAAEIVSALEKNPEQDYLGRMYMELELGNQHAGQFFTPYNICQAMASLSCHSFARQVLEKGWVSVNDPTCGAGATLIAACMEAQKQLSLFGRNWQDHLLVTGQDIDFSVGMMCYIQLSLLGAAGYIKIGNSLTDPMTTGDSQKNYWYTPMYFSDVWTLRRMWQRVDKAMRGDAVN